MHKLTVAFVAATLLATQGPAFAFSKSATPSSPQAPIPAAVAPPAAKPASGYTLDFNAAYALTAPSATAGIGFSTPGPAGNGDQLGIAVSKPVADDKGPVVALSPAGSETDFSIIYAAPIDPMTTGVVSLAARQDADNVPDKHDVAAMVRVKHAF